MTLMPDGGCRYRKSGDDGVWHVQDCHNPERAQATTAAGLAPHSNRANRRRPSQPAASKKKSPRSLLSSPLTQGTGKENLSNGNLKTTTMEIGLRRRLHRRLRAEASTASSPPPPPPPSSRPLRLALLLLLLSSVVVRAQQVDGYTDDGSYDRFTYEDAAPSPLADNVYPPAEWSRVRCWDKGQCVR